MRAEYSLTTLSDVLTSDIAYLQEGILETEWLQLSVSSCSEDLIVFRLRVGEPPVVCSNPSFIDSIVA
jgi:hypothetical protein